MNGYQIAGIKRIIMKYSDHLWKFHSNPNCIQMNISDDGMTAHYPLTDKYRPIYFGYPLSQTAAYRVTIQMQYSNITSRKSMAFFEDNELKQPNWEHALFNKVREQFLKNTPIFSLIGYQTSFTEWRGNTKDENAQFTDNEVAIVEICMDLRTNQAVIKNSRLDKIVGILEGITEHTRIVMIPLKTSVSVLSCEFGYS